MARLPDRFDLWVRKARECPDPVRQLDYVLGALVALKEWYCLNTGTEENPQAAETEFEGDRCLIIFSDAGRIAEVLEAAQGQPVTLKASEIITTPVEATSQWILDQKMGLLVNPGPEAVVIPWEQVEAFYLEWRQRGGQQAAGFWIPNLTTEEEDFWQEHGV